MLTFGMPEMAFGMPEVTSGMPEVNIQCQKVNARIGFWRARIGTMPFLAHRQPGFYTVSKRFDASFGTNATFGMPENDTCQFWHAICQHWHARF